MVCSVSGATLRVAYTSSWPAQVTSGTLLGISSTAAEVTTTTTKSSCFPGMALVQTPTGYKALQEVALGDLVRLAT